MNEITPILVAIVGVVGTIMVGRWTKKTTLEETNYKNAEKLYLRYESLNENLRKEIKSLQDKIDVMESTMQNMQKEFSKEQEYFKGKNDQQNRVIDELNHSINEKDTRIKELEKENAEFKRIFTNDRHN